GTQITGEVLLRLEGVGTAYRIDSNNGMQTDTFDMADFDENVLMARWAPGDSMYLSSPALPGYVSVVPNGYRSYVTVGHDREYDTDLSTRIRDYYVFTDFSRQAWLNEVANLIGLSNAGNADLQSIEIDGVSLSFDPDATDLSFAFFAGVDPAHAPVVTATPQAEDATVSIVQPGSATGTAVLTVTANDGVTMKAYNLNLSVRTGEGVVIFVTNTDWVDFDTYGPYSDSLFVADLQNAGYDVYVTPYSNYGDIDAMEATALEMADLVILGRGISSGDFDDPDDVVWAELSTPVVLMSNFVVRANRLGWVRSNDTQDFARLDTYQAQASKGSDPIFAGVSVASDGIFDYAEENLGVLLADDTQLNGEVLVALEGVGTAYRIDNGNGMPTDTFDLADFDGNVLMARWAPGDSMYISSTDLPGFTSVVPNGYRTYVTVGHDREFDITLGTRIRDYYSLTSAGNTLWLNEVDNLIEMSGEMPDDAKYALLSDLTLEGTTVEGFDPLDFEYTVVLPSGSPVPTVVGVPAYAGAAVAYALPAALPDTAFVEVVSQDGVTTLVYSVFIDVTTNTQDPKLAGINVYPNPFNSDLMIELPDDQDTYQVKVLTMLGQTIYSGTVSGTKTTLNLPNAGPGMYLLQLEAEGQTYAQKIIKK
ncbi:MAG: T9SS type A sorting domain-containing protein, partial [Phaeodactylibacter sp.]|nr:T9SS type A sorting domain-containing protein [Phaeodactylibacter sp.]